MHKRIIPLLPVVLALSACTQTVIDLLENPLYAEYYYDDLTDQMVTLVLRNDPSITDPAARKRADAVREEAYKRSQEAVKAQMNGHVGSFITAPEDTAGEVLLLDDQLHLGPTFISVPGVEMHLYLSSAVDPRDVPFPSDADIDVGELHSPYGPQSYTVPAQDIDVRSVVLWDNALGRLHGFAQVRKQ